MIRSALQFVLNLFDDAPSAPLPKTSEAAALLRKGQAVPIQFSTRRKRGWRLVKEGGSWICQAPQALAEAPEQVHADLRVWIHLALHPSPGSRGKRKELERRIFAWMSPRVRDRVPEGHSRGQVLDLEELFEELNREHFGGILRAIVRWSPRVGGLSTHQELKTEEGVRHLITISRAYDGADVPKVAVAGVLFHEMCHIAYPPRLGRGNKRMVHHREFRVAERQFPGWSQWREWEKAHLAKRVRRLSHLLTTSQK